MNQASRSSLPVAEQIDRLCNRFEDAWQSGTRPALDAFLAEVEPTQRPEAHGELLAELLVLDLHYRRKLGDSPTLVDYQARYPAIDFAPFSGTFAAAAQPASSSSSSLDNAGSQPTPANAQMPAGSLQRIVRLGDYELLDEIARGGMGVVYKARQISLNRIVAVKMILAGNLATRADRDRFQLEAQAAALLDHPNILPVFDVGEYEGQHYFSMGYVDGRSLGARLAEGPLPPKEAAELVATVAEAVEYAHRQGVIHRDIKPSNILIDRDGRPRVTDFGLAKRLGSDSDLTTTGQILGTPSYMAPEQATGEIGSIGPAADVYALGALLYAALAGRPPFQAATPLETLRQVREREPLAVRQVNPAVPRDLETIVLKCLEKPAPRRYATAQALADDLRRYLTGRPIVARPVGRWEHAWRWCRRQPVVAGLIVAVALTLIAGIVVSSLFAADSYRQAKLARDNESQMRKEKARGDENLTRAQSAESAAQHDLANALFAQARLASKSGQSGQRFETLQAIGKVLEIEGPSRKLADEAVAALCLADIQVARHWPGAPPGTFTVAFSPQLDVYARCDLEGNISVRRVAGDKEIAVFHTSHRVCDYGGMEFSPDGHYLRADAYNESISSFLFRIDVAPATTLLADRHIALAFSPDSRRFVARYPGNIYRLCELPSGRVLRQLNFPGETDNLAGIFWNPRKAQIAIVRQAAWRVADLETGKQTPECRVPAFIGISAWHPDGRHLLIATNEPPGVEVYDTLTRRVVAARSTGMPGQGVVPTINHAGDLLTTNDWSGIRRFFDPASGTELLHIDAHDGNFFIFGADDHEAAVRIEGHDLQILRIAMGAARIFAPPAQSGKANQYGDRIAASPDGRLLAIGSSRGISLVDPHSGFELAAIPDRDAIQFDRSGALLTYGVKGFRRWPIEWNSEQGIARVRKPESLFTVVAETGHAEKGHATAIAATEWALADGHDRQSYSLSEDGGSVALGNAFSNLGAIIVRRPADGKIRKIIAGPQSDVRRCALSPDGKWLVTGSHSSLAEGRVNARVWDAATGKAVKTLPVGAGAWVWFSPRGNWLATLSPVDDECRLWRTGSWEAGPRFPGPVDIAFSPDERILAAGGKAGQIKLYETESGREFAILPATAGGPVHPRCFSPDGTLLYAKVEWDTKVHVWDVRRIRAGLKELGLDQGWPDLPAGRPDDLDPPIVEVESPAAGP